MEQVQTSTLRLADGLRDRLARLWASYEADRLALADFRSLAAVAVAQANQAGVQLADIGLAAEVTRQIRRPTAPLGLRPTPVQTDQRRILRDVDRIIESVPATVENLSASRGTRLGDWGRTEPLLTVATAVQTGMTRRGAEGWVRQVDADPCPLCVQLDDGVVRSTSVRMARHPGCGCVQSPIFN